MLPEPKDCVQKPYRNQHQKARQGQWSDDFQSGLIHENMITLQPLNSCSWLTCNETRNSERLSFSQSQILWLFSEGRSDTINNFSSCCHCYLNELSFDLSLWLVHRDTISFPDTKKISFRAILVVRRIHKWFNHIWWSSKFLPFNWNLSGFRLKLRRMLTMRIHHARGGISDPSLETNMIVSESLSADWHG